MNSRAARLARGWVVGAFATAVAALSHAVAGGGTPSGLALLTGTVFAGLLGTFASGPRPSLARLSIAVAGGQLAFHVGFSYLGTSGAASAISTGAHEHGAPALTTAATLPMTAHHADGPLMWVAHGLAGVATILFLRHAERALWSLLTRAVAVLLEPFARTPAQPSPTPRALPAPFHLPRLAPNRVLLSAASRRGPPLPVTF